MKLRIVSQTLLITVFLTAAVLPGFGADLLLFSNGPAHPSDTTARNIGGFAAVSNSFWIDASSTITQFSIDVWVDSGKAPTSFVWTIGDSPYIDSRGGGFGTNLVAVKENWTQNSALCAANSCDVYNVTISGLNVPVPGGQYFWLTLTDWTATGSTFIGWDQNDNGNPSDGGGVGCTGWLGTSKGCPTSAVYYDPADPNCPVGSLCPTPTEDPDIVGHLDAPVPEPSSIMLFGSSILGVAGILRHKVF